MKDFQKLIVLFYLKVRFNLWGIIVGLDRIKKTNFLVRIVLQCVFLNKKIDHLF
jgi:hypothetical protein